VDAAANVFSAVGTVGAFATGMVLLWQELRRESSRAEEQRRSQAVKVSAWIEAVRTPQGGRELLFHVHNASDMPIFEVSLPMPVPHNVAEAEDGDRAAVAGNGAGGNRASGNGADDEVEFIGLVPLGQTVQRPAPRGWLRTSFSPEPVQIEFLDSSGYHWTHDEQGFLIRAGTGRQVLGE
jgi:hypothetical protein